MHNFRNIFIGFFLTFASAWIGLALIPSTHYAYLEPYKDPKTGLELPPPLSDEAKRGLKVYLANGCIYCHSQQVRPEDAGSDIDRGWGVRRTVSRDYIRDAVAVMGTSRTGPDLSNIGVRMSDSSWHLLHLYNPRLVSPGSNMPGFSFLFEKVKKGDRPRPNALSLTEKEIDPQYEVVPTQEALDLVAYIKSLKRSSYALPEAPISEDGNEH
jgi:cytochrome c oxidase cbb3-type subunit 2